MKQLLQHVFNPLHVMCRLIDLGLSMKAARRIVSWYEILYCRTHSN